MISLHLVKSFRNAVTPFSLDVRYDIGDEHKCAVLFGPSGSGKSLTMQCLAGLTQPDAGHIRIGDCTLFDSRENVCVSVQKRRIGYMAPPEPKRKAECCTMGRVFLYRSGNLEICNGRREDDAPAVGAKQKGGAYALHPPCYRV